MEKNNGPRVMNVEEHLREIRTVQAHKLLVPFSEVLAAIDLYHGPCTCDLIAISDETCEVCEVKEFFTNHLIKNREWEQIPSLK